MKKQLVSGLMAMVFAFGLTACSVSLKTGENTTNANTNSNTNSVKSPEANSDSNKSNSNSSSTGSSSSSSSSTSSDLAGTYTVNGTGVDGKSYQGEVIVTKRDEVYQMSWTIGSEKYDGVAVQRENTLAAAYTTGEDGKGCGAVVYKINSDNSLDGKWGEWGVNSAGTEKAVPVGELTDNIGTFEVSGTNPNGSDYKGKLVVKKGGNDTYQFAWEVGSNFIGTGVKLGSYLAVGSGAKQCGFVIYEVKGNSLEGKWGVPGSSELGTEKAVKK